MKILIGEIAHETNTFANEKTTVESFKEWEWLHGNEIIQKHRKVRDYLGGMIERAEETDVEIIPLFSAFAMPSGVITKETYNMLLQELTNSIKAVVEYDAICLALHGAGVAEDVDDLEGGILSAIREVVGYKIPVVVTLDLHGNITDQMVREADVLLGVNFYPHVDCFERGIEAIDITRRILSGELQPKMSLKKLPLMIPTSTTNLPPAKNINEFCWAREENENIIDCTFFHGFPYTNIPEVGVSVVTVTNNDQELADQTAEEIALEIWNTKEMFFPDIINPEEGINRALKIEGKPIVINETSDNPGGGTPGDGTHLLSAMIKADLKNACFSFIYDPEVVNIAHNSGVGASIDVLLGGKTDDLHGKPLKVTAYVKTLADGRFIQALIDRGIMDDVDCLLGIHVRPIQELKFGQASPAIYHGATTLLKGKIQGIQAHGSRPNLGINVVDSLGAIIQAVNSVKTDPTLSSSAKITMVQAGGNNINIIPDYAEFGIDVRAQQNFVMEDLLKKVENAVLSSGSANGAIVEMETLASMIAAEPSLQLEELVGEAIIEALGNDGITAPVITPGGEDFHYYKKYFPHIKATMIGLGTDLQPGLHHPHMNFNLDALQNGVKILALTTIKLLKPLH